MFLGALQALIAAFVAAWRGTKPAAVREGEQLGRAQADLDDVLGRTTVEATAQAAVAQAVTDAPTDTAGVADLMDQGKF